MSARRANAKSHLSAGAALARPEDGVIDDIGCVVGAACDGRRFRRIVRDQVARRGVKSATWVELHETTRQASSPEVQVRVLFKMIEGANALDRGPRAKLTIDRREHLAPKEPTRRDQRCTERDRGYEHTEQK